MKKENAAFIKYI